MKERLTPKKSNRRVTFDLKTQEEITMQEVNLQPICGQPRMEEQSSNDLENQGYGRKRKPSGFYRELAGLEV